MSWLRNPPSIRLILSEVNRRQRGHIIPARDNPVVALSPREEGQKSGLRRGEPHLPSSVVERPLSEPRPSTTMQPAAASASAAASGEVAAVAPEGDFGRGRFGGDQGGLGARALTIWARAGMSLQPGTWRRGAEVVPKFDAVLAAGLQEAEEGVAAVAADVGAGSAADLALGERGNGRRSRSRWCAAGYRVFRAPSAIRSCWRAGGSADDREWRSRSCD